MLKQYNKRYYEILYLIISFWNVYFTLLYFDTVGGEIFLEFADVNEVEVEY